MEYAPRLLLRDRVDRVTLEPGEGLQHAERQVGIDDEREPRGDQRVAPEERHEPRCARGHHRALGVVGIEDAQRTEVLGAAPDDELERREVGFHRGDGAPPSLQPLLGLGSLHRLAAAIAGLDDALVHDGCELHTRRPGAARRHDDLEHGEVHGHLGGFAEVGAVEGLVEEGVALRVVRVPARHDVDVEVSLEVLGVRAPEPQRRFRAAVLGMR